MDYLLVIENVEWYKSFNESSNEFIITESVSSDDSTILVKNLYPVIEKLLAKNDSKFRANIANFINNRHDLLFDIAPYDRIYFNQTDIDNMFKSLGITESEVQTIMKDCFFFGKPYNPQCAKEPYVMTLMMCIRYYLKNNKRKFAELTTIYLAFSGKFYSSLHGAAFPKCPPSKYKARMDYVINNMLTDKFDLKREGTVFGAISSLAKTWLDSYSPQSGVKWSLTSPKTTDDDLGKLVQQLRDRERSFIMNIAKLYYEAEDSYINYETDNLSEEEFRLTKNDAATAAMITSNTMNYITSNYVSLDICNKCKDQNVKSTEIKDIMESIFSDNENLPDIQRVINIMICDFMRNYPGTRVGSIEFVAYTIKAKPNTKDAYLIELKEIILRWLDENSPAYRKRRSRKATANSYQRSILMYLALVINRVANKS